MTAEDGTMISMQLSFAVTVGARQAVLRDLCPGVGPLTATADGIAASWAGVVTCPPRSTTLCADTTSHIDLIELHVTDDKDLRATFTVRLDGCGRVDIGRMDAVLTRQP